MKPEQEALLCAQASEVIYGSVADPDGEESCKAAMAEQGFTNFKWIHLSSMFNEVTAFTATSDEYHLLAFRGTKVFQDWMSDLSCTPVRFEWVFANAPAIGEIHAGFGHCLADGIQQVQDSLKEMANAAPTKPLLITGHSLGGALAALVGAYITVAGNPSPIISKIYTFGQPRIGLHPFCNTYSRILAGKLIRFVNKEDLVPRVPLRGFDYGDDGLMIHFNSAGQPVLQSVEWQSLLARAIQSLEDVAQIVANLGIAIGDHSITGYAELVEKNQVPLAKVLQ